MGYRIRFKKSVAHDLRRIGERDARRVLDAIDDGLVENPGRFPALKGRFAGLRKYRVGDFRVLFRISRSEVLVLKIAQRGRVYRG